MTPPSALQRCEEAYMEVRALRRRLVNEGPMRDEDVTWSLMATAALLRRVSAQLRALDAQKNGR